MKPILIVTINCDTNDSNLFDDIRKSLLKAVNNEYHIIIAWDSHIERTSFELLSECDTKTLDKYKESISEVINVYNHD